MAFLRAFAGKSGSKAGPPPPSPSLGKSSGINSKGFDLPSMGNNPTGSNIKSSESGFQNWIARSLGSPGLNILTGIGAVLLIVGVIFLLILIFSGGINFGNKKKSRRSAAYKKKNKKSKTKKSWYSTWWSKIIGIRNPLGNKARGGLPREIETNGRCDNIHWLSINNGKSALCVNASFKKPDPVRFTIDPTNIYEYDILPITMKNKIRKDTGKLSITIPYRYNEKPSAYVLDFNKAVYEDGTSAKGLFNERFDFDYWNFKTKNLNKAPSGYEYRYKSKFRPVKTDSNYKGVDGYL